jgi:transcription antitermination factor NusG
LQQSEFGAMSTWAVATAFPSFEMRARAELEHLGFVCYLPTFKIERQNVTRKAVLFPGYLFFSVDAAWRRIFGANVFNVTKVLMCGENPVALPQVVIDGLKAREDSDGDIKVELPQFIKKRFYHGQAVRVQCGSLIGFHGVFSCYQAGGVKALFEVMGRVACVTLRAEDLSDEIRDDRYRSRSSRKRLLNKQRRLAKPAFLKAYAHA